MAVLVGILTVCVATILIIRCSKQPKTGKKAKLEDDKSSLGGSNQVPPTASSKVAKSKGAKQWQPKKHTPPTHPLLAADFKGHTGAVLSLDFELGGKYLVSCADGEF